MRLRGRQYALLNALFPSVAWNPAAKSENDLTDKAGCGSIRSKQHPFVAHSPWLTFMPLVYAGYHADLANVYRPKSVIMLQASYLLKIRLLLLPVAVPNPIFDSIKGPPVQQSFHSPFPRDFASLPGPEDAENATQTPTAR